MQVKQATQNHRVSQAGRTHRIMKSSSLQDYLKWNHTTNNIVHCHTQQVPRQPILVPVTLQDSGDQPLQPVFTTRQPSPGQRGAQGVPAPPWAAAHGEQARHCAKMLHQFCGGSKRKTQRPWAVRLIPSSPSMGRKQAAGSTHPPQKALGRDCWCRLGDTYAAVVGCSLNISAPSSPFVSTRSKTRQFQFRWHLLIKSSLKIYLQALLLKSEYFWNKSMRLLLPFPSIFLFTLIWQKWSNINLYVFNLPSVSQRVGKPPANWLSTAFTALDPHWCHPEGGEIWHLASLWKRNLPRASQKGFAVTTGSRAENTPISEIYQGKSKPFIQILTLWLPIVTSVTQLHRKGQTVHVKYRSGSSATHLILFYCG